MASQKVHQRLAEPFPVSNLVRIAVPFGKELKIAGKLREKFLWTGNHLLVEMRELQQQGPECLS